jgi:hypothetical protein
MPSAKIDGETAKHGLSARTRLPYLPVEMARNPLRKIKGLRTSKNRSDPQRDEPKLEAAIYPAAEVPHGHQQLVQRWSKRPRRPERRRHDPPLRAIYRGSEGGRADPRVAYAEINNPSLNLATYRARLSDPS